MVALPLDAYVGFVLLERVVPMGEVLIIVCILGFSVADSVVDWDVVLLRFIVSANGIATAQMTMTATTNTNTEKRIHLFVGGQFLC